MMEIPEVDLVMPSQPQNLMFDVQQKKVTWNKSMDTSKGNWVIGYNIYSDDIFITTVYGNQLILDKRLSKKGKFAITALSSSGIESLPSFINLK